MASSGAAEIMAELARLLEEDSPTGGKPELRVRGKELADEVCDYAKSIAPVYEGDDPRAKPGEFRDSIHVERRKDHEGLPAYRVISRDKKAHWLEFGTVKMPEHATFAKTAAHFGGTLGAEIHDEAHG